MLDNQGTGKPANGQAQALFSPGSTFLISLLSIGILLAYLVPAQAQPPRPLEGPAMPTNRERAVLIQLEPPVPERVFRAESEEALFERIRQEFRQRDERAEFPPKVEIAPPDARIPPRHWPLQAGVRVPNVVCYYPLYFEDKNAERYAWDACIFQPLISTGKFYLDLAMLPYNIGVTPPHTCECNTGYFLPGECVPYYIYLPPLSWHGVASEAAVILGGIAIFP